MLFRRYDDAGFPGCTDDCSGIDRLEGMQIEDSRLVAEFLLQNVGGAHGLGNHRSTRYDAEVFAFISIVLLKDGLEGLQEIRPGVTQTNHIGFTKDEGSFVIRNDWCGFTSEANVLGADMPQ